MKIKYIGHACLFCEAGEDRVLIDPWFETPAYLNQWHISPGPTDESKLKEANAIVISHGHEDHLHADTLARCNRQAALYYPYQPFSGDRAFFREELGFETFVEAQGNRTYRLAGGTRIAFYPVGHDCIIVLDDGERVLVNINDALHASSAGLIEAVCATLRQRHPRIDYVFCGYGGASYFPNCFHVASKDAAGVAGVREALFARNFCLIVERLRPRFAIPFAADFKLRHQSLQWINASRFGRRRMADLFGTLFPEALSRTTVLAVEPGQGIGPDGMIVGAGECGPDPAFSEVLPLSRAFDDIVGDYKALIAANLARYPFPREACPFAIEVRSPERSAWIVLSGGDSAITAAVEAKPPESPVVSAAIGADSVEHLLRCGWHSDVVVIGYGMEFWIDEALPISDKLIHALGDIVTHYPKAKQALFKAPLRFVRWAANNHQVRHTLRRKLGLARQSPPFADVSLTDWLTVEPSELARRLGIPGPFAQPSS